MSREPQSRIPPVNSRGLSREIALRSCVTTIDGREISIRAAHAQISTAVPEMQDRADEGAGRERSIWIVLRLAIRSPTPSPVLSTCCQRALWYWRQSQLLPARDA